MLSLAQFRMNLSALMQSPHERPFVCDGSPLSSSVFLVGFNPATRLESSFWSFWSDSVGFDRSRFIDEYKQTRKVEGVRPRLNAMVGCFPVGSVVETNICSEPTKKAADLKRKDRRTDVFRFLLQSIRPRLVFLHSNEPIKYFRTLLDTSAVKLPHHTPIETTAVGMPMTVCISEGPLFSKKVADMAALAKTLSAYIGSGHLAG